jgi:multidrug efflux pump subunit AcrA (membrane-fusion protein)
MSLSKRSIKTILSAVICFLIIAGGVAGMSQMAKANKGPEPQKKPSKKQVSVTTIPVVKEDIAVSVTGYGQVSPVVINEISPQVSGKIIGKTDLKQGETVQKGEMLFKIDATDYETTMEKALIQVKLQENQIKQLKVSYDRDRDRLSVVKQNTRLAQSNFSRRNTLYKKNRVGTLSGVEEAEQSYNSLLDAEKSLTKSIDLYPLQIAEAQTNLANAGSDLKKARLDVKRCTITAPFTGRIKALSIETGAHITTGTQAVTLADDSILEIQVPLSDKDAFEVLGLRQIQKGTVLNPISKDLECRVETITGNVSVSLPAAIHRVVKYDSTTRTLTLAVRVLQGHPSQDTPSIPLMDGMFCKIAFRGDPIKDAVKIPSDILNPDNTVFLVRNNKLKTLGVAKVMEENGQMYVSGSFRPEDQIITTKLTHPIENTQIERNQSGVSSSSMAENTGETR